VLQSVMVTRMGSMGFLVLGGAGTGNTTEGPCGALLPDGAGNQLCRQEGAENRPGEGV
jgi:hypothetical protein